jgi:hypothetical protein
LRTTHTKEKVMELTIEAPQDEKIDFAVLYGGKVF